MMHVAAATPFGGEPCTAADPYAVLVPVPYEKTAGKVLLARACGEIVSCPLRLVTRDSQDSRSNGKYIS